MKVISAYRTVLASRDGSSILIADGLNKYADWLVFIGANVLLFERGGPVALGVYAAARVGVPMLITPVAGQWGMRFSPKSVMISVSLARALVFGLLALVFLLGSQEGGPPWQAVVVILVFAGILSTPYVPAERRLARDAVPRQALGELNALMGVIASTSIIFAPALGSLIQSALGIASLFGINAAMYLGAMWALLRIRKGEGRAHERVALEPLFGGLRRGIGALWGDRRVASMVLLQIAGSAVAGSTLVMIVPIADSLTTIDDVGYLTSIIGVTSLIGALAGGAVASKSRYWIAVWSVVICVLLVPVLTITGLGIVGLILVLGVLGFMANVADPLYWTTFQQRIPEERSGAAFGIIDANITLTMVVSQGLVGFVLAASSLTVVGIVISVLAAIFVLFSALLLAASQSDLATEVMPR